MAVVQLADIIQPECFAEYMANNSRVSTALFQSGVLVPNALMQAQLSMGGDVLNTRDSQPQGKSAGLPRHDLEERVEVPIRHPRPCHPPRILSPRDRVNHCNGPTLVP